MEFVALLVLSCSCHVPAHQLCDVPAAAGLHAAEEGPGALHRCRAAAFQHPRVALRRGGARIEVNNQGKYE